MTGLVWIDSEPDLECYSCRCRHWHHNTFTIIKAINPNLRSRLGCRRSLKPARPSIATGKPPFGLDIGYQWPWFRLPSLLAWSPSCHRPFLTAIVPLHRNFSPSYSVGVRAQPSQCFWSCHWMGHGPTHLFDQPRPNWFHLNLTVSPPFFDHFWIVRSITFWYLMNLDMDIT